MRLQHRQCTFNRLVKFHGTEFYRYPADKTTIYPYCFLSSKSQATLKFNHLRRSFYMHIIKSTDTSILSFAKPWKGFFKWSRLRMPGVILPHRLFCPSVFFFFIRIKNKFYLPGFVFPPFFFREKFTLERCE